MIKPHELPLLLRLEKARNELRFFLNKTCTTYDLPGYLIDLVLESLLGEERGQRISLMAEQITLEAKEENEDGKDSRAAH